MTSTDRIWLTPQAHSRLNDELTALLEAVRDPAADENEDDPFTTRRARQARIREIRDLLSKAVVGEDPPDDGVAEPGMVLTVRYDDSDETETFLLGIRGAEHADDQDGLEVYSPQSPLGAALVGARRGERRTYRVPTGATIGVTLVDAVPYGRVAQPATRAAV